MSDPIKSISAVRKQPSGAANRRTAAKKRGGENVLWKRVTASFDDAVKKFAANPEIGSPVTRLVFFKHFTAEQGMAARRYATIMRKFERFHIEGSRSARAQDYNRGSAGDDQELERHAFNGTLDQYEAEARQAKRHYKRLLKVIAPFQGAKEMLDQLCLLEIEPPAAHRASCAAVLSMIAKEFSVMDERQRGKR